jgi:hypothetical protein
MIMKTLSILCASLVAGLLCSTMPSAKANVIITEFMASNASGIADQDGDREDWIEVHNGTGQSIDLAGWALTDRADWPNRWIFPPRILPAGQSIVVFASAKDDVKRPNYGPNSELHTNFSLATDGEFLGLVNPAGEFVSSFESGFAQQFTDITYGIGSNGVTGYMHPTTPGIANGTAYAEPPAVLTFSRPSGIFSGSIQVSISGYLPNHTIRFTTDGSIPSMSNGATYSGPITVNTGRTIRARAFSSGVGGPFAHATYTPLGTASAYGINPSNFFSSLPLLVIDTAADPPLSEEDIDARITLIDLDSGSGTARLTDSPAVASRGLIRRRGSSSLGWEKSPYKIEFSDPSPFRGSQDFPVLGMPPESDWVLYSAWQYDPNFMRNVLAYDLYRKMGRWAPATRFVEVFFKNSSSGTIDGNSYRGIYVITESIKIDENRVNLARRLYARCGQSG